MKKENFKAVENDFTVFRELLEHPLLRAFLDRNWSVFAEKLYTEFHTDDWTACLTELVLSAENACTYFAVRGQKIPDWIEKAARHDLQILSEMAQFRLEYMDFHHFGWNTEPVNLETLYFERLRHIGKYGFGVWAKFGMFRMEVSDKSGNGYILNPVASPDAVQITDLIGYERQRKQVIDNTKSLLQGLQASNILLYGDAGTGKSATVKAVANAYAEDGLRLIELSKNELHLLPKLLEELNSNPLKFILFIDDLSFQENDDDFSALKAVLEGSISARANNTVIYATSNRRHIVRETFSQRDGDEVHRNDTVQETISLSERFGIQILFDKPNKSLYLEIILSLAEQYGLKTEEKELTLRAEQFALRKSGRSARTARQFIEQMCCTEHQKINKE